MKARRKEARQTQTRDPQHILSRLALELDDPRTHEVIRKFFLMVEDTRTKSGTQPHQERSETKPIQFYKQIFKGFTRVAEKTKLVD